MSFRDDDYPRSPSKPGSKLTSRRNLPRGLVAMENEAKDTFRGSALDAYASVGTTAVLITGFAMIAMTGVSQSEINAKSEAFQIGFGLSYGIAVGASLFAACIVIVLVFYYGKITERLEYEFLSQVAGLRSMSMICLIASIPGFIAALSFTAFIKMGETPAITFTVILIVLGFASFAATSSVSGALEGVLRDSDVLEEAFASIAGAEDARDCLNAMSKLPHNTRLQQRSISVMNRNGFTDDIQLAVPIIKAVSAAMKRHRVNPDLLQAAWFCLYDVCQQLQFAREETRHPYKKEVKQLRKSVIQKLLTAKSSKGYGSAHIKWKSTNPNNERKYQDICLTMLNRMTLKQLQSMLPKLFKVTEMMKVNASYDSESDEDVGYQSSETSDSEAENFVISGAKRGRGKKNRSMSDDFTSEEEAPTKMKKNKQLDKDRDSLRKLREKSR